MYILILIAKIAGYVRSNQPHTLWESLSTNEEFWYKTIYSLVTYTSFKNKGRNISHVDPWFIRFPVDSNRFIWEHLLQYLKMTNIIEHGVAIVVLQRHINIEGSYGYNRTIVLCRATVKADVTFWPVAYDQIGLPILFWKAQPDCAFLCTYILHVAALSLWLLFVDNVVPLYANIFIFSRILYM